MTNQHPHIAPGSSGGFIAPPSYAPPANVPSANVSQPHVQPAYASPANVPQAGFQQAPSSHMGQQNAPAPGHVNWAHTVPNHSGYGAPEKKKKTLFIVIAVIVAIAVVAAVVFGVLVFTGVFGQGTKEPQAISKLAPVAQKVVDVTDAGKGTLTSLPGTDSLGTVVDNRYMFEIDGDDGKTLVAVPVDDGDTWQRKVSKNTEIRLSGSGIETVSNGKSSVVDMATGETVKDTGAKATQNPAPDTSNGKRTSDLGKMITGTPNQFDKVKLPAGLKLDNSGVKVAINVDEHKAVVTDGKKIFYTDGDKVVWEVSAPNGFVQLNRLKEKLPSWYVDGNLLLLADGAGFHAFDLQDGKEAWRVDQPNLVSWSLFIPESKKGEAKLAGFVDDGKKRELKFFAVGKDNVKQDTPAKPVAPVVPKKAKGWSEEEVYNQFMKSYGIEMLPGWNYVEERKFVNNKLGQRGGRGASCFFVQLGYFDNPGEITFNSEDGCNHRKNIDITEQFKITEQVDEKTYKFTMKVPIYAKPDNTISPVRVKERTGTIYLPGTDWVKIFGTGSKDEYYVGTRDTIDINFSKSHTLLVFDKTSDDFATQFCILWEKEHWRRY